MIKRNYIGYIQDSVVTFVGFTDEWYNSEQQCRSDLFSNIDEPKPYVDKYIPFRTEKTHVCQLQDLRNHLKKHYPKGYEVNNVYLYDMGSGKYYFGNVEDTSLKVIHNNSNFGRT